MGIDSILFLLIISCLIKQAHEQLARRPNSAMDLCRAFLNSKRAVELAEKAFFDPSMTAMVYFPIEHQYAVYAPLFFPMAVPLLSAFIREIKAIKAARRHP